MSESFVFLLVQLSFASGFCLGRILSPKAELSKKDEGFFAKKSDAVTQKKKISIDDAKFVTDVSAKNFQQSNLDLGKQTSVDDDISSSVNRLAHLKKSK